MARRFLAHCFALAALGVSIPALHAQDNLLDDLYGRGVHAYFSRNYLDAHHLLSDAIVSGSKDPRVYYFRALALNRLGRPDEATTDLVTGASLEFSGDEPVKVGRALERIQGAERLMIEDQRSKARLSIRNAAEERAKVRYEERIKAEEKVLRNPPAASPPAEAPAALPAAPPGAKPAVEVPGAVPAKPAADDPFGEAPPAKPAEPPAEVKPVVPAKPAAEDPFGEAPAKPAAPPAEAPPGEVKAAAAVGAAPATPGSGTTLGSFMRAITKAVPGQATGAAARPAVEEAPIPKGDPNAPDPFGDAPPAKPAAPPAATPPAGAKPPVEDPFKDDAPAKPAAKGAAADDPFK